MVLLKFVKSLSSGFIEQNSRKDDGAMMEYDERYDASFQRSLRDALRAR